VDSWKRNAEPNRQESQAGNRSIALARTHGPVLRYTSSFVGRVSAERRECNDIQRTWFPLRWHVTSARATQCYNVTTESLLHFKIYPRNRLLAIEIFISRVSTRQHEIFSFPSFVFFYASSSLLVFTESKIEINKTLILTPLHSFVKRIFDISRLMRRRLSFVCLIINSYHYLATVIA